MPNFLASLTSDPMTLLVIGGGDVRGAAGLCSVGCRQLYETSAAVTGQKNRFTGMPMNLCDTH